jgi:dihydroceramidase
VTLLEPLANSPVSGIWGTPTSSVDWCEANYEHTRYVCELFNTLSSLAIVAVGGFGLWMHRRTLERRFSLCFASVALVGLGSIAFHATLRFELQMADELPMLYSAIIMVYILLENQRERRFGPWLPLLLGAHAVLVTALTAFTRGAVQFYAFHASFGSLETFSLWGVYRLQRAHGSPSARRIFRWGIAAYLVAVLLWFIDLEFCPLLGQTLPSLGLFNPQLHAVWHLLVSAGFYALLVVTAHIRLERLGERPTFERWRSLVPVVRNLKRLATAVPANAPDPR